MTSTSAIERNAARLLHTDGTALEPRALEWAASPLRVEVADEERIRRGHRFFEECLLDGRPVYGATTGFGPLVVYSGRSDAADQCRNVLDHLIAGQGPDLEPDLVRAAMLVRLWSLAAGRSGASMRVIEALTAALATDLAPAVPRLGSLGASGDLVPLAYLARALEGQGHAYLAGQRMPAGRALERAGLRPLVFQGRDALAMVNGTSLTTAAAGLALLSLHRSAKAAVLLTAALADVLGCTPAFLDPELLTAFGHGTTADVGRDLRGLLAGSDPRPDRPLQEPYSIRCTPQLIGAAVSAMGYADEVVRADLGGVSDNPLVFPEQEAVAHGGNFFGQPAAFAADLMTMVGTQLGNLAERQLDLLIDPRRNGGLPPMLSPDPGRQHALQGVQVVATAMVADMRRTAHPASVQSLPTNWHNQDVIPFGTQAAFNALDHARSLRLLHGALGVALRQAVHLGERPTGPGVTDLVDRLCAVVDPVDVDRPLDADVRAAADVLDAAAGS
nr:aromatic amino acid ammonia-lyase [Glycomyces dulcitolivorans]